MPEWFMWFTRFENSKMVALVLFFVTFCAILVYVYTGKRKARLESYKYIPLQDDDDENREADSEQGTKK